LPLNLHWNHVAIRGKKQKGILHPVISISGTQMVTEILEVTDKGVIAVIGLRPADDQISCDICF
jgi:hypothetical protein